MTEAPSLQQHLSRSPQQDFVQRRALLETENFSFGLTADLNHFTLTHGVPPRSPWGNGLL